MKHSLYAPILHCCKFFLLIGLFSACGNSESPTSGKAPNIEAGLPSALKQAKWVFETQAGIFIQEAGKQAEQLAEGGKWPRISPDGDFVAYLKGNDVCTISLETRESKVWAQSSKPKTLAIPSSGKEIWYSEGKEMKAVTIETGEIRSLVKDGEFLEVDTGPDGIILIATVKSFGYKVRVFNLLEESTFTLGKGCSASLSPDGRFATNNLDGHQELAIFDRKDGSVVKKVLAPQGIKTDNQFWSNHADWIASIDEETGHILAHRVSDGKAWKLSDKDGGDRPDVWIP
jgi:hypothetical protein